MFILKISTFKISDQDEVLPKRHKPLPYMSTLPVNGDSVINNNPTETITMFTQPLNGIGVQNNGFPIQGV